MKKLFYLLIVIILNSQVSKGQWSRLNCLDYCNPTSIISFNDTILCSSTGINISTDEGVTWNDFNFFSNQFIYGMINFSDTIIVFYQNSAPSLSPVCSKTSFDGGTTWSAPHSVGSTYYQLKIHKYGQTIMVDGDGLYQSSDYGLSWTTATIPFNQTYIQTDFFDKLYITYTTNYTTNDQFTYYGQGGNLNSTLLTSLPTIRNLCAADTVIFGYQPNTASYLDIIRTNDYGMTWQPLATVPHTYSLSLFAIDSFIYYSLYQTDFYVSYNLGNSWNNIPMPHKYKYSYIIPISGGDEICKNNLNGMLEHYISLTDSSYPSYAGILNNSISSISHHNNNLYVSSVTGNHKSSDFGNSWTKIQTNNPYGNLLIMGDTLLLNSFSLEYSFDDGATWFTTPPTSFLLNDLKVNNNRIYGSWQDVYFTDNLGNSWTHLPDLMTTTSCNPYTYLGNGSIEIFNDELYVVSDYDGVISKYTNNAWTEVYCWTIPAWTYPESPKIISCNQHLIVYSDTLMLTSTDGLNWTVPERNGLPYLSLGHHESPSLYTEYNGSIIGLCSNNHLYFTNDGGNNWTTFLPVPPFQVYSLSVFNNHLYAGSIGQGLWMTDLNYVDVKNDIKLSESIQLFPNPTSDFFSLQLPGELENAELFIYDQLGKLQTKSMINHDTKISVNSLKEGLYYGIIHSKNKQVQHFKFSVVK